MSKMKKKYLEFAGALNELDGALRRGDSVRDYRALLRPIKEGYFSRVGEDPNVDMNLVYFNFNCSPDSMFFSAGASLWNRMQENFDILFRPELKELIFAASARVYEVHPGAVNMFRDVKSIRETFDYVEGVWDCYKGRDSSQAGVIRDYISSAVYVGQDIAKPVLAMDDQGLRAKKLSPVRRLSLERYLGLRNKMTGRDPNSPLPRSLTMKELREMARGCGWGDNAVQ